MYMLDSFLGPAQIALAVLDMGPAGFDPQRPDMASAADPALVALDRFVPGALRTSRVRFLRRILRRRSRPNLALSPFLSDTGPSS
jgi:hypothetical protein